MIDAEVEIKRRGGEPTEEGIWWAKFGKAKEKKEKKREKKKRRRIRKNEKKRDEEEGGDEGEDLE